MLSLSFSPDLLEAGRQTPVELLVTNQGPGHLYSVRLVPRFPPGVRVSEGPGRITIRHLEPGATSPQKFVLVGESPTGIGSVIPFPVISFEDDRGEMTRSSDEVPLRVGATGSPVGQVVIDAVRADDLIVGRWGWVLVELRALDEPETCRLELRLDGEVEQNGITEVAIGGAAAIARAEIAARFGAAGAAVPVTLRAIGVTDNGRYVQAERQEYLSVTTPSEPEKQPDQNVYNFNIGKVEGNVGPDGTFNQHNTGGVVGRSSSDSISNLDPQVLADLQQLLSTEVLQQPEHREDRETIEAVVRGEAEPEQARSVVRKLVDGLKDGAKAVADDLTAETLVRLVAFAAESV